MESSIFSNPIRTSWRRTWGIVNLVKVFNDDGSIKYELNRKGKLKEAINPDLRYLFFELDSLDEKQLREVLSVYFFNDLPVLYHRTMRGYHFISIKPISNELHAKLISSIKHLNTECPHVTIRIKPNKWKNEDEVFKRSSVQIGIPSGLDDPYLKKTIELQTWMTRQHIGLIKKHYKVVNYPFGEEKQ